MLDYFIPNPSQEQIETFTENVRFKPELEKLLRFIHVNNLAGFIRLGGYGGWKSYEAFMDFVEKFNPNFSYTAIPNGDIWLNVIVTLYSGDAKTVDDLIRDTTEMFSTHCGEYLAGGRGPHRLAMTCPIFPSDKVEEWLNGGV